MEKIFSNKKLAYALIGILLALQLTQSIAIWCGGGFNGGSLILCILMLGLLILVGVGISKKNKLLTIINGVSILSVFIYVLATQYSGLIAKAIDEKMPVSLLVAGIMFSLCALLFVGSLMLIILKTLMPNKNLKTINNVFCLLAVLLALVGYIIGLINMPNVHLPSTSIVHAQCRDVMVIFFPLLIASIWHQIEIKE